MSAREFEVGRLLCSQVRDYLARCQMLGNRIQWREGSGWISRVFTVVGDDADSVVDHLKNQVYDLNR